ncbi:MAG TPA: glycine cleavage T C-terminal barrel domain-containing protein, partial [Chitinophagaceae bacterium]|nr:glycine cleavage T C-terminal barrel domain-containing protein [Chitinophagaceae bacterium]
TRLNKATDFTAKEILQKQKAEGIKRKLAGFEMIERGIPRHNYQILDKDNNLIGYVTSGTQAPSLAKAIGLGYVTIEHAALDTEIFISIRNNAVKAKVVKFPFV